MRQPLLMPKLGLTMTEGLVAEWSVGVGEPFKAGQCLYIVETDKVANEIPADADGVLVEQTVVAGQTVAVGTVLGYWDGQAVAGAAIDAPPPVPTITPVVTVAQEARANTVLNQPRDTHRVAASPYARKLAREHRIDLTKAQGSGPGGRIVARDVVKIRNFTNDAREAALPTAPVSADPRRLSEPSARQRAVAQRLTQSKQEIPHFYLFRDIDVTELLALRKKLNHGETDLRISMTHLITRAIAMALTRHPEANRVWTRDGIEAFDQIDVGIAVDTDNGLVAPALSDIGNLGLEPLARRINDLIDQSRAGKLISTPDAKAAITLSNAGMHDVTYMSSIINPGQSMILGVGAVKPVFRPDPQGQPLLRQELGVVLSVDHRVLNGVDALKFLNTMSHFLARPLRLLVS